MTTLLLALIGVFVLAIAVTIGCAKKNAKKNSSEFKTEPSFKANP